MRKPKKEFPPGTFIPTPQRILAIIQLCLAFSLLLWYATQPFMGEYFNLKSRLLIYEYVMGTSDLLKTSDQKDKLKKNVERFALLDEKDQDIIRDRYQSLQDYSTRPTLLKIKDGIQAVLWKVPPFELAWIFFSVFISILLLKKVKGATAAVWLLPIIALAYGIDNQITGKNPTEPPDLALFPTESVIVNDYLKEPLSSNLKDQQNQLKMGWERYLVANWSKDYSTSSWTRKLEEGEFNFTLARLQALHASAEPNLNSSFHEKSNLIILMFYCIWNVFFAFMINKNKQKNLSEHTKLQCN